MKKCFDIFKKKKTLVIYEITLNDIYITVNIEACKYVKLNVIKLYYK